MVVTWIKVNRLMCVGLHNYYLMHASLRGTGRFKTLPGRPVLAEPANLRELHGRLVSTNGSFLNFKFAQNTLILHTFISIAH